MGIHQQTETFRWSEEVKQKFAQVASALERFNDTPAQVHRSIIRIVWDLIFIRDERRVNEIVRMLQGLHCGTLQNSVSPAAVGTPKFGPISIGGESNGLRRPKSVKQADAGAKSGALFSSFRQTSPHFRLWSLAQ